jgi:hypothetical protein
MFVYNVRRHIRKGFNPNMFCAGYCQIHMRVVDVNDNAPQFGPTLGLVTLPENSPENTIVFAKEARDRDSGLNGKVNYRLVKVSLVN